MKNKLLLAAALSAAILLVACGGAAQPTDAPTAGPDTPVDSVSPTATPSDPIVGAPTIGVAVVDSIDILILESFPVQVHVAVKGNLPDGCTQIGAIDQSFDANTKTFTVKVGTTRPGGVACTEALVPYEQNIALEVNGLPKGTYTVNVNGQTATFELTADNILNPTP